MKTKFTFLLAFSILVKMSSAQLTFGVLSQADKKFHAFAYPEAIELYEYLIETGDSSARVIRNLAESYRNINQYEKAEFWYSYIVGKKKCNSNDVYKYVLLLRSNEKYNKADSVLVHFDIKFRRDSRIEKYKKQPAYVDSLKAKVHEYEVKKLNMNTKGEDHSPAIYDNQLVFVSSRGKGAGVKREYGWTKEPFLDYYAFNIPKVEDDEVSIKVYPIFQELNSVLHEGQITFSKSGGEAYFTSNNLDRNFDKRSSTGTAHLMIYRADFEDGEWRNIRPMRFNVQEFSFAYPTLSIDGKTLYFSSNRSGGMGGADLYKVTRNNYTSDWSGPIHLGSDINTEGNEVFPFIHNSGDLYFSSDGHPGLGGLDIFKTTLKGQNIIFENLGIGINSPKDDFGFVLNKIGTSGYFSSNRDGGVGKDDIYGFTLSKEHFDRLNYVKLDAIVDSLYTFDLNDPLLLDDPELVEKLRELGFIRGSVVSIKASDISELEDEELREKLKKLGLFDSETLGMMLDEDTLFEKEKKRKRLQKLSMIQDSIYTMDLSDSDLLDDPELVEMLTDLGYLKDNILTIKASEISKLENTRLKNKLSDMGLMNTQELAKIAEDSSDETKITLVSEPVIEEISDKPIIPKKKLQKLSMIQDSIYRVDLTDSDLLDDPEFVKILTELGYLKDNILTIKASEISELENVRLKNKLREMGLMSIQELAKKREETKEKPDTTFVPEPIVEEVHKKPIILKKKLQKLDMIKDSIYTIELSDDAFLDDPSLYAELEEMGYIKDNVLKIKSSEIKKLDRNIKERLAKIGIFDRKTLGLNELPNILSEDKEVETLDYFIFTGSIQEHNSDSKLKGVKILIRDKISRGKQYEGKTDDTGVFRDTVREIKPNTFVDLLITLKKKGYISKSFQLKEKLGEYGTINLDNFLKKIQMTKFDINVEIGSAANLNPIYFEYNKAEISEKAKVELNKLVEILLEEPRLLIELGSHTDSKGNDEYNLSLSERRAESTKEYVVSMGVEAFRIKAVGYGETKLKNRCSNNVKCSDEEHAINRRTEFRVIGLN